MTKQTYPVMEIFYTIQGEGAWSGNASYFIRLAGCDVGCVWCDVKESWDASGYPAWTTDEIIEKFEPSNCKMVVITGGEPAMYDLTNLTVGLKNKGYKVHIETSGAYNLTGNFDWVCFSPKKFKKPKENFVFCNRDSSHIHLKCRKHSDNYTLPASVGAPRCRRTDSTYFQANYL